MFWSEDTLEHHSLLDLATSAPIADHGFRETYDQTQLAVEILNPHTSFRRLILYIIRDYAKSLPYLFPKKWRGLDQDMT